jgi:Protein of unknown function (DUF3108)
VLLIRPALLLLLAMTATAAPFTAFRDGETFSYKVGFALFPHAGDLVITAHDAPAGGRDLLRITTDMRSNGLVRSLYAFDNKAEVIIDRATGRMQSMKESGADPRHATDTELVVDYDKRTAHFTDHVRTDRSGDVPLPEGDPLDLISALVQTRDWNLKPGERRDAVVQFGPDFYELTIEADSYEDVHTPLGDFKTLVLVPRMEKNPKGLFKKGGEIKVWIAQSGAHLPVKMQLKLKFGSATMVLNKYDKGSGAVTSN